MEEKRVLYVSPLPPPAGGMATWTRILTDRGLPPPWSLCVVDTAVDQGRGVFSRKRRWRAELVRTVRILRSLAEKLAAHWPHVAHVNIAPLDFGVFRDLCCVLLIRAFRVPVVVHHHGLLSDLAQRNRRSPHALALLTLARLASCNVVLNEPSRKYLTQAVSGRSCVKTLPNFYDERAVRERADLSARRDRARVIYVGGVTPTKGALLVIDVARALPQIDFELVGRVYDEARPTLEKAPPNVFVHGEKPPAAVLRLLRESDVFLLPSKSEGFPYSVLEAMAVGLPVVATAVGAIPEMVETGKGGFVVEGEPREIARAVSCLVENPVRAAAMGKFNSRKSQALYAYSSVRWKLLDLYEHLW